MSPGSIADGPLAGGAGAAAAPTGGAIGGGGADAAGPFTPTGAQQAAASARGIGGGGGGPSAVQQYASNLNKSNAIQKEIETSRTNQKNIARALELEAKKGTRTNKETDEFYTLAGKLKTGDPRTLQAQLDAEKAREDGLEREKASVAAQNREAEKSLSPKEKARAVEEAMKEVKREQERQQKEKLKRARPDYRATQLAKAKRAGNKRDKSLLKASKLLKAAKNPNMSKSAKKKAVDKAKKELQKAKEEGRAKLDAMKEGGASLKEIKDEQEKQAKENAEVEEDIAEVEADIGDIVPEPDPCTLPCDCTIDDCDPPDWCICSRRKAGAAPEPKSPDEGGGGAAEPTPPEVVVPDGSTVSEEKKDDGDAEDGGGDKLSGDNKDGGGLPPGGGINLDVETPDGGPIYFQEKPDEEPPQGEKEGEPAPPGTGKPAEETPQGQMAGTGDEETQKRRDARAAFIEKLEKAIVEALRALAKNEPGWPKSGLATADPDAWKEKQDSKEIDEKDTLLWKESETGIYVEGDPAAGIEQLFKHPREFGIDCTGASWLAWYKGLLDVLGKDKFNSLFETSRGKLLIIDGAWSSGSGIEQNGSAYFPLKIRSPGAILVDTGFAPGTASRPGDRQYLGKSAEQTGGGETVVVVTAVKEGQVFNSSTEVYGHGAPDRGLPTGIKSSDEFEATYGNKYGKTSRLRMDDLFKLYSDKKK